MFRDAAVLLVMALALGGCDLTGAGSGPSEGGGLLAGAFSGGSATRGNANEPAAAAVTAAAIGGLIGSQIGSALNDSDRRLAYQAQLDALDRGAPGVPVAWRNPESGRYGNIVPGPSYNLRGAKCRAYTHTVTINGQLVMARRTACRSSEGVWSAVS